MIDISKCLDTALRTLGVEKLKVLHDGILIAVGVLVSTRSVFEVAVVRQNILMASLNAKVSIAKSIIDGYNSKINFIPQQAGCVQIGDLNMVLKNAISSELDAAQDIVYKYENLLSLTDKANYEINKINAEIQFLTDVDNYIMGIIGGS